MKFRFMAQHSKVASGAAPVVPAYLSGGISAANCVRAYTPKGAASLAASYVDATGNQDAAEGTPQEMFINNPGFETVTSAGPPADFANWTETVVDGNIEVETTIKHGGSNACKLTCGATVSDGRTSNRQNYAVTPGAQYTFSFWTAGDGTNAGAYRIYNNTALTDIVATTTTGITAGSYSQISVNFTAPAGCVSARFYLYPPPVNGGIAYFDDVSLKPTTAAPVFAAANGWQFDLSSYQYLTCGLVPGSTTSVLMRCSNVGSATNTRHFGAFSGANKQFIFNAKATATTHNLTLGNYAANTAPNVTSGVVICTPTGVWIDGTRYDTISATWGTMTHPFFIGCNSNAGTPAQWATLYIQAWWAYDIDLNTSTYIADLTAAAAAL